MSIIYNALQKAQQNRQKETKKKVRDIRWFDRLRISAIAVLIAAATYDYIPDIMDHAKHAASSKHVTAAAPIASVTSAAPTPSATLASARLAAPIAPATTNPPAEVAEIPPAKPLPNLNMNLTEYKNSHVLSGVYLSDEEKIALINNKFFHLGDEIDGMKLVSIEPNRIVLRYADNALILQADES